MGGEERMEGRRGRSLTDRHRRLRQDHLRGPRSWRLLAAEVRGRRAPGPARAEDRGAGPHPHVRRDSFRAARGRSGRGRAQAGRPRDQGFDVDRPGRTERQHHVLRHPHHPQADRSRREHPGREVAAAEQREGDASPSGEAVRDEARGTAGSDRRAAARHGPQRQPVRENSHVQLQGQPRHRSPHQPDPAQARPRHDRRPRRPRVSIDRRRESVAAERRQPSRRHLTIVEVLKLSADYLQKRGSDSSRLDAELLLAHALKLRRLDLYLKFDHPLNESELTAYRGLVARRAKGEPVAYLVGHKEFMGLDFEVTPDVLVPNPDTEVLVQRAVELARDSQVPLRVADVGTGSGCIAVSIAHYAPATEVWASDVSREALEVTARNVSRHRVAERVHLECGDLLEPLPGQFDLICANLPYIDVAADHNLAAEVVAQPARALYAEQGGVELVNRLLQEAPARLKPGGRILAEVDPSILAAAVEAASRGFAGYRLHRDAGGHERGLEVWS